MADVRLYHVAAIAVRRCALGRGTFVLVSKIRFNLLPELTSSSISHA